MLQTRRGFAILFVLGTLSLLSVVAVTLVAVTNVERSVSANYVMQVRARLAAESGIAHAMSALESLAGTPSREQWDWLAADAPGEAYLPLRDVQRPSFRVDVDGDGVADAYSGLLREGRSRVGYKLRVEDESGKFNLNQSPGVVPMPARLRQIVERIARRAVADDDLGAAVAERIAAARDALGGTFSSMEKVQEALAAPQFLLPGEPAMLAATSSQWRALARDLTTNSWIDPNTLLPNPPDFPVSPNEGSMDTIITTGTPGIPSDSPRRPPADYFDYDIQPGQEDMGRYMWKFRDEIYTVKQAQCQGLALEPRAPVNVNAASRELIAALLEGIQGCYIYEYGHQYLRGGTNGVPSALDNFNRRNDVLTDDSGFVVSSVLGALPPQVHSVSAINYRPIVFDAFRHYIPTTYSGEIYGQEYPRMAGGGLGVYKKTIRLDTTLGPGGTDNLVDHLATALHERIHGGGWDLNGDGDTDDRFEPANPFRVWQEFQEFIYAYFGVRDPSVRVPRPEDEGDPAQPPFVPKYARQSIADAILANFNPNAGLADWNPNRLLFKRVDKAHLINDPENDEYGYTTEFCLEPTGVFSVQSLGLVEDVDGRLVTESEIHAAMELFRPYRQTSQAQFLGGDSPAPVKSPEDFARHLLPNVTAIATAGAREGLLGTEGEDNGYTMQVYPEPVVKSGGGEIDSDRLQAAVYDGYVMPATLQDVAPYRAADGWNLQFRASFNGVLDADVAAAGPLVLREQQGYLDATAGAGKLIAEQPAEDPLMISRERQQEHLDANPGAQPLRSGNLYVDGGYSEAHRSLCFAAGRFAHDGVYPNGQPMLTNSAGNFGSDYGQRGQMSFWVKPNWHPERAGRPHTFFDITSQEKWPLRHYAISNLASSSLAENGISMTGPFLCSTNPPFWNRSATAESGIAMGAMDLNVFRIAMLPSRQNFGAMGMPSFPYNTLQCVMWTAAAELGDRYSHRLGNTHVTTPTANLQHLPDEQVAAASNPYHVLGHRWSLMTVAWEADPSLAPSAAQVKFHCNGVNNQHPAALSVEGFGMATVPPDVARVYRCNFWHNFQPNTVPGVSSIPMRSFDFSTGGFVESQIYFDNYLGAPADNALMRFGQWARGQDNFCADATFDEIRIYDKGLTSADNGYALHMDAYRQGRYYQSEDAPPAYVSAVIDPHRLLGLPASTELRLRSTSWTLLWPDEVIESLTSSNVDGREDANPYWEGDANRSKWDPVSMDIAGADGKWLYTDNGTAAGSLEPSSPFVQAQGSRIRDEHGGRVRLRGGDSVRYKVMMHYAGAAVPAPVTGGTTGGSGGSGHGSTGTGNPERDGEAHDNEIHDSGLDGHSTQPQPGAGHPLPGTTSGQTGTSGHFQSSSGSLSGQQTLGGQSTGGQTTGGQTTGGTTIGGHSGGGPAPVTTAAGIHEAPVIDDVTLFFEFSAPRILSWHVVR